ncbi:ATP-binding cassette sub-family C member 5-like isoform X2 [Phymastichus coffea]|nr:ATP-binding cassette sub-family C member 5-like isoform X2 [Phymastichus coffea]
MNKRTALRLKSVCLSLLFKRVLHLNNVNANNTRKLIEMLTKDGQKIYHAVDSAASIIVGPIVALCVVICSSLWLNSVAVLGLILFLVLYVVQYWFVYLVNYCEENANEYTRERIQKTVEIMENIKLIKINGWEQHFIQSISNIRNKEGKWLWKLSYVKSLNSSTMDALPVIAIIMMFFLHGTVGYNLKVSIVFPICVVIMVQMNGAFRSIKPSLSRLRESLEIFKNIKGGLLMEDTSCHPTKPYEPSQAVAIVNGTFVFDIRKKQTNENEKNRTKDEFINKDNATENEKLKLNPPTFEPKRIEILTNITFKAKKGQLIGICGRPSSGKSSLLLSALGQIKMINGQLMRQGSCAYVGQKAWLANATIKENILFEEVYDAKRYYEAQVVCQLRQDIRTLTDGDETEVGDDGVDVTESFRQRIALARAFYADRDIYFLDDPLSSMEDKISSEIFEDLIIRALAEKTILLVTQELEYLDRCDYMYIIRDGKIAEHGRHKDLMRLGREYASMVKAAATDDAEDGYVDDILNEEEENYSPERRQSVLNIDFPTNKSIEEDEEDDDNSEPQGIPPKIYLVYIKFLGSYFLLFSVIMSYLIYSGMQVFSLWRLAAWIQLICKNSVLLLTDKYYLLAYYHNLFGFCSILIIIGCIVQSLAVQYAAVKIGRNVHTELINKLVYSPMRIFDFSSKRMKKLFSYDLYNISLQLPLKLDRTLRYMALGITTFFVLISTIPWFSNYVVFTSPIFYITGKMYIIGRKNFKHLEYQMKMKTNMFLENTMQGLSTIRTFKKETDLLSKYQNIVDINTACCFIKGVSERWLLVRLQLMSTIFILVASTVIIILEKEISPTMSGLTFIYILTIPNVMRIGMRYFLKIESSLHSVQNICSNTEILIDEVNDKIVTVLPELEWPTTGTIEFDKAVLKYNNNDEEDVLDCVSFSVGDGEKIGVLNLSGSDENALILALYRLYELNSGSITIDKVDLSKISIKLLRSRLSIVPQDPIFYGTIRFFLDPKKQHTDAELWNSLEKVHMKDRIAACASQLHYTIDGKTFNVIEKQLLYLARAFLSQNKILVLEECEAPESLTGLVHQVIEKEFPDVTALLITRRLRTVLSCNRVLVMDGRGVLEFDKPSSLLADPNSNLKQTMVKIEEMNRRM